MSKNYINNYILAGFYFFIAVLFSVTMIDLSTCQFDACRYVRERETEVYWYDSSLSLFSWSTATLRMHFLYSRLYELSSVAPVIFNAILILVFAKKEVKNFPSLILLSGYPGKDLFVILALLIFIKLEINIFSKSSLKHLFFAFILIFIARPIFILLIPCIFIIKRFSQKNIKYLLLLLAILIPIFSYVFGNIKNTLDLNELELVSSFAYGELLRKVTNGYSVFAIIGKSITYIIYLLVQPFFEFIRLLLSIGHMSYFQILSLFIIVNGAKWIKIFSNKEMIRYTLICCVIIAGTTSIIHTRYVISLVYPFFIVLIISLKSSNK